MTLFRQKYRIESARKRDWDYTSRDWYFVTICTRNKICCLGTIRNDQAVLSAIGNFANDSWREIPRHYSDVTIDQFVVMPNHMHGIVVIEGDHIYSPNARLTKNDNLPGISPQPASLGSIIRSYKSGVTLWCHQNGFPDFQWQPRYHDRIIGSNTSLAAVQDYIRNNPANW
ncbi:MAG TPA: transposase [Terriglobales bacterium]|nr:transposase [Terriglobales bacterium]